MGLKGKWAVRLVVGMASAVAVVGAPAVGHAASTVGNTVDPNGFCSPGYTLLQTKAAGTYQVPFDGVITAWSFEAGNSLSILKLKVGRPTGPSTYEIVGQSELQAPPLNTTTTYPVRIPVKAGDIIGFYFPIGSLCAKSADPAAYIQGFATGDLAPGSESPFGAEDGVNQDIAAKVEPDLDQDGFGDESQDLCPTNPATQGTCPLAPAPKAPATSVSPSSLDTTKPTLGGLSFSSTVFEAAKSGASTAAARKVTVGTEVSFSLSEASSVKFTVQHKARGRRVGKQCKTATHANRTKKACTIWKAVKSSFTLAGKPGENTFTFRGRVGGKALKPGSYRLNGTATDPSKNASVPKQKGFKIVK